MRVFFGLKRILRIIGLVWLMGLSTWMLTKVVDTTTLVGSGQGITSAIGLLLLIVLPASFWLGGNGR